MAVPDRSCLGFVHLPNTLGLKLIALAFKDVQCGFTCERPKNQSREKKRSPDAACLKEQSPKACLKVWGAS